MFDCGIHPALSGENSLPYLSNEDLEAIDVALITHFHLDHCAAVPFLLQKTVFKVSGWRKGKGAGNF
jgi:cleavage and polyadenylation specificity factor subunit 3